MKPTAFGQAGGSCLAGDEFRRPGQS